MNIATTRESREAASGPIAVPFGPRTRQRIDELEHRITVREAAIAQRETPAIGGRFAGWTRDEIVGWKRDARVAAMLRNDFAHGPLPGYIPNEKIGEPGRYDYEHPETDPAQIDICLDVAVGLVLGDNAANSARSFAGMGGYDGVWMPNHYELAAWFTGMSGLAGENHILATAAFRLTAAVNPHGARRDIMRRTAEALSAIIRDGADDVERRTGPEPIRQSEAWRPYSVRECLLLTQAVNRAMDAHWSPGWCLQRILAAEGLEWIAHQKARSYVAPGRV